MYDFPELSSIIKRRRMLGISQRAFAIKSGISQSMMAKIEGSKVMPNYDTAVTIFRVLDEIERSGLKKAKDVMLTNVLIINSNESIKRVKRITKSKGISQFPITEEGKIIGSISVNDMLDAKDNEPVSKYMSEQLPTINEETPVNVIKELLKHNKAVLVVKKDKTEGIITAVDLL